MAYNILKDNVEFSGVTLGTIEDMVDDHTDQSVGGVKTFTETVTASSGVSASFFYGDGSNLTNVGGGGGAITGYGNHAPNRLVIGGTSATEISGANSMTYDGTTLAVTGNISASINISGSGFYGDGGNLTNIGPSSLRLGNGLRDLAGNLEIRFDSNPGLRVDAGGLEIYLQDISTVHSPMADNDEILVDVGGAGTNARSTMQTVYNYVNGKLTIPTVDGASGRIQLSDGAGDLTSSPNLTFNSSTNTLTTTNITASSHVSASTFYGDGSNLTGISGGGGTSLNIFTASFNVLSTYDVVGMSTSGSVVTASLPGASSLSSGQRLVFKDVGGSGSVNDLVIEPSGSETIDGASFLKISTDWGAATIVSDGVGQYFIIGTN